MGKAGIAWSFKLAWLAKTSNQLDRFLGIFNGKIIEHDDIGIGSDGLSSSKFSTSTSLAYWQSDAPDWLFGRYRHTPWYGFLLSKGIV